MEAKPTVFVVDDEPGVRHALRVLLESVGWQNEAYESATHFLAAYDPERPGCLVLDLRMPGLSGLDLQRELVDRGSLLPIIFLTAHAEVPTAVRAMRTGAIDFLEKPFNSQVLLDRVQEAVEWNRQARRERAERTSVAARLSSLTAREREVLDHVIAGKPNKRIAADLGVTEKTVEFHRSNLMAKLRVSSLAELVRLGLVAEREAKSSASR